MKTASCFIALCLLVPLAAAAQPSGFQDPLLDKLAGDWVMRGTIAGNEVTHDITAEWVLDHYYLRLHEVARETDERGRPAYEAIVFIGSDEPTGYACLWLDTTGGSGLSSGVMGHARRSGDTLPFVFDTGDGSRIHNTFVYDRETDTWQWLIDNERDGDRTPFARVTLTRRSGDS